MKWHKLVLISLLSIMIFGCDEDLSIYHDNNPPATPTPPGCSLRPSTS